MTELAIVRTPDIVAAEINAIKDQTRKIVINNSIEIGKRLCEAKEMIPYGAFGMWLEDAVEYSQSTANNLMKIYEEYGSAQGELWGASTNSQAFGNLSYSQAVVLLGVPAEEREAFANNVDAENLSVRELQKQVEEYKKAAVDAASESLDAKKALEAKEKSMTDLETYNQSIRKLLDDELKNTKSLKKQLHENSGKSVTEIESLKTQLKEAEEKIGTLQTELNKPVTIEADSVEKIPDAVERELEELRAKAAQAELTQGEEAITKYKIHFEDLTKCFSTLMEDLAGIQDQEKAAKFRAATIKLIDMMSEKLAQELG